MRMVRTPCCDKESVKRGTWSAEEDAALKSYVNRHGTITNWIALPQKIGLNRCGKSCRLRWLNYLRPDIKHGKFTEEEDKIISGLYFSIGSRWSVMADKLPGRTDNDIKNHWNTKLKKKIIGNQKKSQKRPSFRGLKGGSDIDHGPSVFTITNGHLMSTTWPPTSHLQNQQEIASCAVANDGGGLMGTVLKLSGPIIVSFSSNNTCSGGGGGGGGASPAPLDQPVNNITMDHQSMAGHFCFYENGSSSGSSYDLMPTLQDMHDMDVDMNIDFDVECGSTSTPLEVLTASLKELQDLLFDETPTPNMMDSPDDFFPCCESLESWEDEIDITSLISILPMEDNKKGDALNNSNDDCQEGFLPQDILDQFS